MKKSLYILFVMLLVAGVIDIALAGPVNPVKKCKTCGKPLSLCPGHDTAKPKKERSKAKENKSKQKSAVKKCKTCGNPISVCGGKHSTSKTKSKSKTSPSTPKVQKTVGKPKEVSDNIYRSVEQMPQFPGGDAGLMKYLSSHINYPPMAAENNVQGKVILQFVVEKDGRVGEVKVARSVDKDLDKEAIRVVKSLPKFTPGRHQGQVVRVWYTLPVTFKLTGTFKSDN